MTRGQPWHQLRSAGNNVTTSPGAAQADNRGGVPGHDPVPGRPPVRAPDPQAGQRAGRHLSQGLLRAGWSRRVSHRGLPGERCRRLTRRPGGAGPSAPPGRPILAILVIIWRPPRRSRRPVHRPRPRAGAVTASARSAAASASPKPSASPSPLAPRSLNQAEAGISRCPGPPPVTPRAPRQRPHSAADSHDKPPTLPGQASPCGRRG